MKILHVNKFLYRRGGAEAYMEDLAALQVAHGDEVTFFGMDHPENTHAEHAAHFPSRVEFDPPPASVAGKARGLGRMLWSRSAAVGMERVVDAAQPDVVHLHNIYHQLSPSILRPLARRHVPTVMTLHDYKLACPTYRFLDHGEPCEACLDGNLSHAVRRRCNGSMATSAAVAAESYLHRRTGAYAPVGVFVCPSTFMTDKMRAAGVFPDRLRHVPHFVDCPPTTDRDEPATGIVYAGRLSGEKGIDTLIQALRHMKVEVPCTIVGEGPERSALERLAAACAPGRVSFAGRLARSDLHTRMRTTGVVVVPSRWYENQPMIVLEAFALEVPVVATDLGGTTELVVDGSDGRLVPPNDPVALAAALDDVLADTRRARAMGRAGRAKVERDFSPQAHLERLGAAYADAGARA